MSKGNPIARIRMPREMLATVDRLCTQLIHTSKTPPPDRSDFIRRAVAEKIAHMERSRKKRRRPRNGDAKSEG